MSIRYCCLSKAASELTQSIRGVNHKEENTQGSTVPSRSFHVNFEGFIDEGTVEIGESCLSTEGLGSANCGDDFFCQIATLSDMLQ